MGNFEIDDEQLFDSLKNEDLYYNKDKELKNDINYQNSKINNFNHLFKIHDILIRNGWFSHGEKTTNEQVPYKHYIYSTYNKNNGICKLITIRVSENKTKVEGLKKDCFSAFDCYQLIECRDDFYLALDWEFHNRNSLEFIKYNEKRLLNELIKKSYINNNNFSYNDFIKKMHEELAKDFSITYTKNYNETDFIENCNAFNAMFSIHDVLTRNGYTPVLSSYVTPHNIFTEYTSIPMLGNQSITLNIKQINTDEYVFDVYGTEPLQNNYMPQNAFEFYCRLECDGDIGKAIDQWRTDINNNLEFIREKDKFKIQDLAYKYRLIVCDQSVQTLPKQTTLNKELIRVDHFLNDEPYYYSVDLLRQVSPNHIMRRLAEHIAQTCDLPVSTVFLIGLAVFSGMSCRKWVVEYPDGGTLPTCLYVVAEQPSGTSKTRALTSFQRAFTNIIHAIIELYNENLFTVEDLIEKEKEKEKKKELITLMIDYANSLMPTTNTTPAGLEKSLIDSNGFFSAVSSEQGLFNTLLGLNFGGGKYNNNDILLNGRDGGFINVRRMGRDCYAGHVVGNIICFAQEGSIEKVISASNGTGVSERFLMIAEPHQLGQRNHTKSIPHQPELFREYEKKCLFIKDILDDQARYDDLIKLKITESDWYSINIFKNEIEPYLMDGQHLSHGVIRGAVNKVSMQVMGIAANLHLLEDEGKNTTIDSKHIQTAIDITRQLIQSLYNVCVKKDMIGTHAEFKAILDFFVGKPESFKPTAQEIKKSRTKVKPFTSYNRKSLRVQQALDQLVEANLLLCKDNHYILNCIM
ncbi:MAG: hypothetical protein RLZZ66_658 [Pseudomonadota bacterium]|jgi:hypothetical protein